MCRQPRAGALPKGEAMTWPFPSSAANPPTTDLFAPCAVCGHDPRLIVLDPQLWAQIVLRGTEDAGLQALIDQAVMGPKR